MIQVDKNLWRGPRPNNLEDLKALGFTVIISLESGIYEFFHADTLEKEEQYPGSFGIRSAYFPMNDFTPPKMANVINVLNFIQQNRDSKIYLHCKSGVDRTGYVCMAYRRAYQNWTKEAAIAEWIHLGRHPWFFWWRYQFRKDF